MDDVIVHTRGTLLRYRSDLIEEVADAGDLPVLRLGSEVACGVGATTLGRKMSPPKDFKRQRGTVVVVHLETEPDDRPRVVELGVELDRDRFAWFTPDEVEPADNRRRFPMPADPNRSTPSTTSPPTSGDDLDFDLEALAQGSAPAVQRREGAAVDPGAQAEDRRVLPHPHRRELRAGPPAAAGGDQRPQGALLGGAGLPRRRRRADRALPHVRLHQPGEDRVPVADLAVGRGGRRGAGGTAR